MSAPDGRNWADLEGDVSRALRELAPTPDSELLARTMRLVASTPQRRPLVRPGRLGWGTLAVAAAGIVAGVAVGLSAASLIGSGPGDQREPHNALEPDTNWERIALTDPIPGVHGGAIPNDVVAFKDGYVIVGSFGGYCTTDIAIPDVLPAPGCEDRLAELTTETRLRGAAVWISDDGWSWESVESPNFEEGEMVDAATDGERLVVSGRWYGPGSTVGPTAGDVTIWTSTDGRHWEVATNDGPLPEFIEWTPNGWVGARNTQGPNDDGSRIIFTGPEFFASEDGLTWAPVTDPGEFGPGRVDDLAGNGNEVVAVGYHEISADEGLLASTPLSWRTTDGQTWEPAPDQDSFAIRGTAGGLYLQTVAATSDGWLAVGRADDTEDGVGAWKSSDGLTWTRLPNESAPGGKSPEAEHVTVDELLWTDPGLVATGSGPDSGTVWVSADGLAWQQVSGPVSANWGIRALIADGDLILAAGANSPSLYKYLPVVLVTTR